MSRAYIDALALKPVKVAFLEVSLLIHYVKKSTVTCIEFYMTNHAESTVGSMDLGKRALNTPQCSARHCQLGRNWGKNKPPDMRVYTECPSRVDPTEWGSNTEEARMPPDTRSCMPVDSEPVDILDWRTCSES